MRLVSTSSCPPGSKLARNIYNENGLILLSENVELTKKIINRLQALGIDYIYIQDARTDDIVAPEPLNEETRRQAIQGIRESFRDIMEMKLKQQRTMITNQLGRRFQDLTKMILENLCANQQTMLMLVDMSAKDHYLFQHSLNVCMYTSVMGMAYGYDAEELLTLSMGALLHDIGKTLIPDEILLKEGPLDNEEYEQMKQHAEEGYRLLKDMPNIPLLTAHCAFQHHERLDGSGYPRGICGDDIHEYAKWIAIADSYDAMTTNRVYRKAMLPHEAMEVIYGGAGSLYEQKMVEVFRDKIALYPIGITVRLNTGEVGVVVDLNKTNVKRPIVRILRDAQGQELQTPYEIDLSKHLTTLISSIEPY